MLDFGSLTTSSLENSKRPEKIVDVLVKKKYISILFIIKI
jgi:hypothetical protein